MALVQNQGLRKFILPEGTLLPKETMELDNERAEKLCKEYEGEFVILQIQAPKQKEKTVDCAVDGVEVISEEEAEKLESGEKIKLEDLSREELMQYCDKVGIEYRTNYNKPTLLKVIREKEADV